MPKASFHVETTIQATPETVFNAVADLTKHGEWSANPLTIEAVSPGPVGVGSHYRSKAKVDALTFTADLQVTRYQPPHEFGFAGEDATGRFEHLFKLDAAGNGTRLQRRVSFRLTLRQWLIFMVILYPVRLPAARKALDLLKQHLEQS